VSVKGVLEGRTSVRKQVHVTYFKYVPICTSRSSIIFAFMSCWQLMNPAFKLFNNYWYIKTVQE